MSFILAPAVIKVTGIVIVGAVFILSMFLIVSSFLRLAVERKQRQVTLDSLRYRAKTILVGTHQEAKRDELTWSGFRKFRVQHKVNEVEGVHSFYLVPHDGKPLPPFLAGQYLTFQLRLPDEPKPLIRCYSLSDGAHRLDHYRVSIKKILPPDTPDASPGRSSAFFNDHIEEGDILDVKAPSGHFVLDSMSELPIVLIGGGIGITPVFSMLSTLTELDIVREVWFFLGVRNSAGHLMREQLNEIQQANENLHLHVCYSEPQKMEEKEDHTVLSGNDKPNDGSVWLICTKAPANVGVEVGHVLELSLSKEYSIGRGKENTLSVQSNQLSRNHLKISFSNDDWIVEDIGSTNGTFVNGDKIQSWTLKVGDSITFGGLEFEFQMDAPSPDNDEYQKGYKESLNYHHSSYVSLDLMKDLLPSNNYAFYICGPPPMMQSLTTGLKEWGVPESDIHFEAFGPATIKRTKADTSTSDAPAVEVNFARSGKTVPWDPSADSLLDFAEDNDIFIESGCRAGNCGTCITAIKSGEVIYVADPGSPLEVGSCLTCVSVPKTTLTLDV